MKHNHVWISPFSCLAVGLLAIVATGATRRASADGGDWPQWRGPERDGISRETDWVAEGNPDSVWEKSVGLGYSTVSIRDGLLYTLGYDRDTGLDVVWCLDAETGEEIWTHTYPSKIWAQMHSGGTLTTPSIDGDVVYTTNREGRVFCFDAKDGEVLWERHLVEEYEMPHPKWGFGASPLVLDDMIVLNMGNVIAVDKESGETLWKSEQNYGDAYSTPQAFELDGRGCLAVFASRGLAILEREKGAQLQFHEWRTRYDINAATPIVIGDKVFISSGMNRGCALIEVDGDAPKVVWENKSMCNKMSGCVLVDGHLYGFDDRNMLKCMDLDGEEKWRQRGLGLGALLAAGDRLIVMSSKGELVVAEATPEGYQELSRTKILDGGVYWTTPVLSNGRIYCRNSMGELVCRDHRPHE